MSNKRIYAFDAVKFAAAICIIFHHYQAVLNVQFERFNFNNGTFYFGYLVELFFIVSGFLAASGIPKIGVSETFGPFLMKRCIRLLPINILAATIHIFVIYLSYGSFHIWGWVVSAFGLFALDPSFAVYGVNPPCWYVSTLLLCSICFYIITCWSKRNNLPLPWIYAAVVLLGLLIQLNCWNFPVINSFIGRGLFAFFIGLIVRHVGCNTTSLKLPLFAVGVVLSFAILYILDPSLISEGFSYLLTLFVYPSLVILCTSPLCHKLFCCSLFPLLGEVSFGMYLLHTPMLFLLSYINSRYALDIPFGSRIFMILFAFGILLISFVSLFMIERPVTKKLLTLLEQTSRIS